MENRKILSISGGGIKCEFILAYVGEMELSNHVVISDPCYRKAMAAANLADVMSGKYHCYVLRDKTGVRMMVAMHEQHPLWNFVAEWEPKETEVAVDSGQCGIYDDSIFPEIPYANDGKNTSSLLCECSDVSMGINDAGIVSGKGFNSSSGGSDGGYRWVETNTHSGFAINFMFPTDGSVIALLNAIQLSE